MSYILDALRKADAERERDPARGIHAQPVTPEGSASSRTVPALGLGAIALAVVAGGALFAWNSTRTSGAPASPVVATPAPAPAPLPVTPPAAPPPAAVAPAAAVQVLPAPPPVVAVAPAPAPVAAKPGPVPAPAVAAPKPAPAASSAPASAERVVALAELPPEVQRELPKLAISGGVYSDNAAQRMLIVGGQVVNEGADLGGGLVLEQIRPKAAVFKFRGWRYSVAF